MNLFEQSFKIVCEITISDGMPLNINERMIGYVNV